MILTMIYIMSNCLVAASNEGDGKHCLFGFQFSSVSHGFIDGFWRRLWILVAKIKDFLFRQCLHCILMREVPALSMCTHTNEGIPSTEHVQMLHWACADMLMRGNPVTD